MSTTHSVQETASIVDIQLRSDFPSEQIAEFVDVDCQENVEKRKCFNSPEITCSPSPCVFDYDANKSSGNMYNKLKYPDSY